MIVSRIGKIYRVDGGRLGLRFGHDVVVVGEDAKFGTVKVRTITSLEHGGHDGRMHYDFKALEQAKRGRIIPIPVSDIGSCHWSGIHMEEHVVFESDLREREICSKESVPKRWVKVIR